MAITKEQLKITVDIDSKEFDSWAKSIDDDFNKIASSSEKLSHQLGVMKDTAEYLRDNFDSMVSAAKSISDIAVSYNAFSDTLIRVGNAFEYIGERFTVALGDENFLKRTIWSLESNFLRLGRIFQSYSINVSNFAQSIRLYTYSLAKASDPAIVKYFLNTVGLIAPALDVVASGVDFAGVSIARTGVFFKNLEPVIDSMANRLALFTQTSARSLNLFGQSIYVAGTKIAFFARDYWAALNVIFNNRVFLLFDLTLSLFAGFKKVLDNLYLSVFVLGLGMEGVWRSFIKLGPALGKASMGMFEVFDVINNVRIKLIDLTKSFGSSLIGIGLSVQRFGIDITNLSGRIKVFASSFREKDSPIMQFFARGIGLAAPLIQNFSDRLDFVSKKMAGLGLAFRSSLPFVGEFASSFQLAGKITSIFGKTVSGFGKDAKNIVSILTAVADTQVPFANGVSVVSGTITNLTAGIAGLGIALIQSDSAAAKFTGGTAIAMAVALGGLVQVAKAATGAIGDLVTSVGTKLFTAFDAGIQLAAQDEDATNKFTRSIERLSGSFDEAQTRLVMWESVLKKVQQQSAVTESDSQAFAISISKIGQEFSLTAEQQKQLAINISAFSRNQEDLVKTTDAVRMSLLGQSRSAEELGIHLNDSAVSNGKYAEQIGKTVDAMSAEEKVVARLIALNEQSAKANESIMSTGESLIEVNRRIKVSQEEISAAFAKSSIPVYKLFSSVQLTLMQAIEGISQPIKNLIATLVSYTGAALVVIGLTVKWGFTIGILATAIAQLNTLIKVSAGLQGVLTLAFTVANGAVNQQVVAITGLTSVFSNMVNFTKGMLITSLTALGNIFVSLSRTIWMITVAVLSNPIFWKVSAVVTAISAVVSAVNRLTEKSKFLQHAFAGSTDAINKSSASVAKSISIWEQFANVLGSAFDKIVALAEIIIGGLLEAVNVTAICIVKLRQIFGDKEDEAAYQMMIEQLSEDLYDMTEQVDAAGKRLGDFGGTAYAATAGVDDASEAVKNLGDSGEMTASKLERMTDRIVKAFNVQRERLKVLGDDYDKINARILDSQDAVQQAMAMPKDNGDKAKAIAEARIELIKAEIDAERTRQDVVTKMMDEQSKLKIDQLKYSGQNIQAINLEFDQKLKAITAEEEGLKRIGKLRLEDLITTNATIKAIKQARSAAFQEERLKGLEKIRDIQEKITEIQRDNLGDSRSEIAVINEKVADRIKEIDTIERTLKVGSEVKKQAIDLLEIGKRIAIENGKAAVERKRLEYLRETVLETKELARTNAELNALGLSSLKAQNNEAVLAIYNKQKEAALNGLLTDQSWQQFDIQRAIQGEIYGKQIDNLMRSKTIFGTHLQDMREYFSMVSDLMGVSLSKMFDGLKNSLREAIKLSKELYAKATSTPPPIDPKKFVGPPAPEEKNTANKPGPIATWVTEAADGLSTWAGKATDAMGSVISDFIPEGVSSLASDIGSAVGEMGNIYMMIAKIIMELPKIILGILDGVTSALQALLDFPRALVNALGRLDSMLTRFTDNIPKAIQGLAKALPNILRSIAAKLPDLIIALADALPELMEALAEVIPDLLARLLARLPDLVSSLTKSLGFAVWRMIVGLFRGIGDVWKGIKPPAIKLGIDKDYFAKSLASVTQDTNKLFTVNALTNAYKNAESMVNDIMDSARGIGKNIWKYFVQALKDGWKWLSEAGGKIWEGLKTAAATIGDWGTAIWNAFAAGAELIGEWGTKIWNGLTGAIGDVAETIGKWGKAIWDGLVTAVGDIAKTFGDWGTKIWNGFTGAIGEAFTGFGKSISDGFTGALPSIGTAIDSLFTGLGNTFKSLFKLDLNSIKTSIENAFSTGSDIMKGAFKAVFNPMIDVINGIIEAFNALKIPAITYGGSILGREFGGTLIGETDLIPGELTKVARLATGGLVTGPGGIDRVPAMLTAGEFVINKDAASSIGLPGLLALNSGRSQANPTIQNISLNLTIENKDRIDENFVRQRIMPALKEELKRGSLDGRAVVYSGGVRK